MTKQNSSETPEKPPKKVLGGTEDLRGAAIDWPRLQAMISTKRFSTRESRRNKPPQS